jgi:hypothetical protein
MAPGARMLVVVVSYDPDAGIEVRLAPNLSCIYE